MRQRSARKAKIRTTVDIHVYGTTSDDDDIDDAASRGSDGVLIDKVETETLCALDDVILSDTGSGGCFAGGNAGTEHSDIDFIFLANNDTLDSFGLGSESFHSSAFSGGDSGGGGCDSGGGGGGWSSYDCGSGGGGGGGGDHGDSGGGGGSDD